MVPLTGQSFTLSYHPFLSVCQYNASSSFVVRWELWSPGINSQTKQQKKGLKLLTSLSIKSLSSIEVYYSVTLFNVSFKQ